jgi:hypothetical protein
VRPRLTNEQLAALVGALDLKESSKYQEAVECVTQIRTLPHHVDILDGNAVLRRVIARSGRT